MIRSPEKRTLRQRIEANLRYYGGPLKESADAWWTAHGATRHYNRMTVPEWNSTHASALAGDSSALSKLLASGANALSDAERVLKGEFRLFGHCIRVEGQHPDWHCDYLSGHRYPALPYPLHRVEVGTGADIICAWELSRLQFVPSLIAAHRSNGDRRFREAFLATIADWESANPYLQGVNWMCGLDIAIRALNIAVGISAFECDDPRLDRARRLLWSHLVYLQKRDLHEPKRIINNHHLIAVALQAALLHLFRGNKAAQWRRRALTMLNEEVLRQFRGDGGNFESATAYHQFALEAVAVACLFIAPEAPASVLQDGGALAGEAAKRLQQAFRFSAALSHAYGAIPQLGDSSDGRILFHRDYFAWAPDDPAPIQDLAAVLLGADSPFSNRPCDLAEVFADSGIGVYANEAYGLVAACMPVTELAGGHNHLDRCSFVLQVAGHPILVDAGTACYTSNPTRRGHFREGRSHNVLLIAGHEPGRLPGAGVFETPDFGATGLRLKERTSNEAEFHMFHHGYQDLPTGGRIQRRICCTESQIELVDLADCSAGTTLELVFNLHPAVNCTIDVATARLSINGQDRLSIDAPSGWSPRVEEAEISDAYRRSTISRRLVFQYCQETPREQRTVIRYGAALR